MEITSKLSQQKNSWDNIKTSCLKVFVSMLKIRAILSIDAVIFISVCFIQIYGTILEDNEYVNWNDDIADEFVYEMFRIIRIIPLTIKRNITAFYWSIYGFCNSL